MTFISGFTVNSVCSSTLTNLQLSGVKRVWTKEGVVSSPDKVQVTPPREPIPPAIEEDSGTVREVGDREMIRQYTVLYFC